MAAAGATSSKICLLSKENISHAHHIEDKAPVVWEAMHVLTTGDKKRDTYQ